MMSRLRTRLIAWLPWLTVALFFVLLVFSLLRLALTQQQMRLQAPYNNMLWVLSQAQTSLLQLGHASGQVAMGTGDTAALQRRRQVLASRFALMQQGPQRRQLQALGHDDVLQLYARQQSELDALLDQLRPGAIKLAAAIDVRLQPLQQALTQAATQAMIAEWDALGHNLETSRARLQQVALSLTGLLLAGAGLSIHLLAATRRARRQAHLLGNERAFSARIIRSNTDGILAIDTGQRCTVCNPAAARLLGQPASVLVGQPLAQAAPFFASAAVASAITQVLDGQSRLVPEQSLAGKDGAAPRYLQLRCAPIRAAGEIVGAIIILQDVTQQRAAQRELALHRDHLEALVQARTSELDAALARERRAAELYRHFGTLVSHEFRTPLAIVDSALQRLIRQSQSGRLSAADVRQRSERARDALRRLLRLIESTLDAARLDGDHMASHGRRCDLAALTAQACTLQRERTPARCITLDVIPKGALPVICDPVHTEHILLNLLGNAARYAPAGTPIHVRLDRNGEQITCAVRNAGQLAADIDPERLFERYYRGHRAASGTGLGIGLYMARALARLQGGELALDTSAADTVTFVLALPAAPHAHHEPSIPSARAPAGPEHLT